MAQQDSTERFTLHLGDCFEVMRGMADASVDSIVTDPPYELGFMGKTWDGTGIANSPIMWAECLRVLKPGGHLLAFSGSRTYHRMVCAIEDAGFEVRDQIMWLYGSGFPKSMDVSKAIDKAASAERQVLSEGKAVKRMIPGADQNATGSWIKDNGREYVPTVTAAATDAARQWEGWGTALKPAHEPICVARKPLAGKTVAANVLEHGTGALNIDACRVATHEVLQMGKTGLASEKFFTRGEAPQVVKHQHDAGRWPANVIHDGSDEVMAAFPQASGAVAPVRGNEPSSKTANAFGEYEGRAPSDQRDGGGSAARFFYCAKTSRKDRNEGLTDPGPQFKHGATLRAVENTDTKGNTHPTVKPTDLMAYLCRLVTPPGGVVLDPFMGSGSTGKAAMREGFRFVGIDMTPEYLDIARARIAHEAAKTAPVGEAQADLFGAAA